MSRCWWPWQERKTPRHCSSSPPLPHAALRQGLRTITCATSGGWKDGVPANFVEASKSEYLSSVSATPKSASRSVRRAAKHTHAEGSAGYFSGPAGSAARTPWGANPSMLKRRPGRVCILMLAEGTPSQATFAVRKSAAIFSPPSRPRHAQPRAPTRRRR